MQLCYIGIKILLASDNSLVFPLLDAHLSSLDLAAAKCKRKPQEHSGVSWWFKRISITGLASLWVLVDLWKYQHCVLLTVLVLMDDKLFGLQLVIYPLQLSVPCAAAHIKPDFSSFCAIECLIFLDVCQLIPVGGLFGRDLCKHFG